MTIEDQLASTESEWDRARVVGVRTTQFSGMVGLVTVVAFSVIAYIVSDSIATGWDRYAVAAALAFALFAPVVVVLVRSNLAQQERSNNLALALERELREAVEQAERETVRRDVQVRRQEFEGKLANALEMAEGEPEVLDTVERALAATLPGSPVELLLADNSHAHLERVVFSAPDGQAPDCKVDSPDQCPAARRAQVQQFDDSDEIDACPKLRNRSLGRCSAVCVPVSIMGRTVGVIHALGEPAAVFDEAKIQDLGTLANLAGARIGLLRVMAETQLQASTDNLTGLLNRRSFENAVRVMRVSNPSVVVAMADLDNFKRLNDTYGHETGDRALRIFATTLQSMLGSDDLVSRQGGEEFAIVLPGRQLPDAVAELDAIRDALERSISGANLPRFTASFGVVDAHVGEDLATILSRADAALFEAKAAGRDRVVTHDRFDTSALVERDFGVPGLPVTRH